MRNLIAIILSIVLLAGAVFLASYFIKNKKKPKPVAAKIVKTVFTEKVVNKEIPIVITSNGTLVAKNKVELFSEVQGVLVKSGKEFKPGTKFYKGEPLLRINSDEFYANLQAQKSNLFNNITSIMPDIRLDFPNEYSKWQTYLQNFDLNKTVQKLPEFTSEKEKFFISGRGILTSYYNVKNLEVKLGKYTLRAPFNGVLTEALVNPGTLIRPGQKLGEFINPAIYEIGVSIKSKFRDLLQIGKKVELHNLEKTKSWIGKVVRINAKVNSQTQTVETFIEVTGNDLKEGEYLEVSLDAKPEKDAYEVPRNLLIDNSKLYLVKDSVLQLAEIQPIYETSKTIVVKGLNNGDEILTKPVSGAHEGMTVKVITENSNK